MRASLTRFAAHHDVAGLYHETLTCFWLKQVEIRLDRTVCLCESIQKIQMQLADKDLAFTYYSRELLNSPGAKKSWLQPDLEPARTTQS
jgi:hypothetical protein